MSGQCVGKRHYTTLTRMFLENVWKSSEIGLKVAYIFLCSQAKAHCSKNENFDVPVFIEFYKLFKESVEKD